MNTTLLDAIPLWMFDLLLVLAVGGALDAGYRFGLWRRARAPDERDQPVAAIVGSILGLLALVLGFTFGFAASRFDARRQVVLQEANAIGTTYLRTRLLPDEEQRASAAALREYVDVRLQTVKTGDAAKGIKRSEELQQTLWNHAMTAGQQHPNSVTVALYIDSLNKVIDLHEERLQAAFRNRIPGVLWIGLVMMALLSMSAVGYQAGLSTTRRSPVMLVMIVVFTITLALIADLDRSQEGLLRVGQQAMLDVQQMMQVPTP